MGSQVAPVNGLLVFEPRLVDKAYLVANAGGALQSSYTQAGSLPGVVTPEATQSLVPAITNGQSSQTVNLRIQRSGHAGKVAVTYDLDGDTKRGWLGVRPVGWESLQYTSSATYSTHASVVLPRTQRVVTVYAESGTGSVYSQSRTVDDETWTAQVTVTTATARRVGLYVIERDDGGYRLVCLRIGTSNRLSTYYSDDEGASWAVLAAADDIAVPLGFAPNGELACCVIRGELSLIIEESGPSLHQYASADGGVSWDLVETSTVGDRCNAASLPDGSGVVSYRLAAGAICEFRRLGGAYQPLSTAAPRSTGFAHNYSAITADGSDIWILIKVANDDLRAIVTRDGGLSFDSAVVYNSGLSGQGMSNPDAVSAGGRIWLFHNHLSSAGGFDGSLTVLKLSAWSSVEWTRDPTETWLPFDLPSALTNWTSTGGGSATLLLAHLRILTSASSRYFSYAGPGHSLTPGAHIIVSCTSGGSVTTDDAITQVTATTASKTYAMRIRFSTTQLRILDNISGATVATVTIDMTEDLELRFGFSAEGVGYAYRKRPNDTVWTEIANVAGHAFTDGGALASNWSARVGNQATGTATTFWRFVSVYDNGGTLLEGSTLQGRILSGVPYPLAECVDDDDNTAHLSVRGGIGLQSETYEIAPRYRYPIEHALIGLTPSPAKEWRSAANTEQIVCWDLGERSFLGAGIGLYLRTNAQTAYLEYHDGTGWQTLATYNGSQGFATLDDYTRTGEAVQANTGATKSLRAAQEGEFADGGWALLDGTYARYVRDHTSGYWTDETPTVSLRMNLQGITGAEPSTGAFRLVASGGLLFAYPSSSIVRRYWRVRFPVQTTPDGFLRCSALGLGRLYPFGRPWAWGATRGQQGQYDTFTDYAGAEVRRRRGPDKRTWGLFFDASPEYALLANSDHDYIGVTSGGNPIALEALDSVPWQLSAILERTEGQRLPVVGISAFSVTDNTMVTDRSKLLFGYLTGGLDVTYEIGREHVNGHRRVGNLRIEESV